MAVQRLAVAGQDLQALRLELARLDGVDWHSTAAAAFRTSLADGDAAFLAAGRALGTAVDRLSSYGMYLRTAGDAGTCANPNLQMNPGIGIGWGGNVDTSGVWSNFSPLND
jgi:pyridoxal biosynthesis lyase PdxS